MGTNTFNPTSFSVGSSSFVTLASLLVDVGFPGITGDSVTSQSGYIKNNSSTVNLYVGFGTSAPTYYSTIPPLSAIVFQPGLNVNNVWVKAASSTVSTDFVEGAANFYPVNVNGVVGTISATQDVIPKADSAGDLVASTITDDGSNIVLGGDTSVTGTVLSNDATTPILATATGKTNTGYLSLTGKTSGSFKVLPADATAQVVTMAIAAQTSGASTLTIPDQAGVSSNFVFTTLAQTLTNKTLTAPVVNAGNVGTSLVPTSDDGAALGDATHNFSDLFLASGAVLNYANGNVAVTHSSGILTVGTGELRVTTAGTNAASVPTLGSSSTFTNKTLTSPAINTPTINSGAALGSTSTEIDQLNDVSAYQESVVAAGALSVTKVYSGVALVGAGAVTLAAPSATMLGQQKTIEMTADNGDVTLVLTNCEGQSSGTTATFNDVGDKLIVIGGASKWTIIKEFGITLS